MNGGGIEKIIHLSPKPPHIELCSRWCLYQYLGDFFNVSGPWYGDVEHWNNQHIVLYNALELKSNFDTEKVNFQGGSFWKLLK